MADTNPSKAHLPTVSIVVSTYNRQDVLPGLVENLNQIQYAGSWDVIFVDNNSSDSTMEVLQQLESKCQFPVHIFHESQQGLSYARNRGVEESISEIIAIIDDDGRAESNWLTEIVSQYLKQPDVACVGGPVALEWGDIQKPSWFSPLFVHTLSYYDLHLQESKDLVEPKDFLIGCNLTFRREDFVKIGGFDPNLGRKGNSLEEGEDGDLQSRFCALGKRVVYNPKAKVRHLVFPHQAKKSYYIQFYWGKGLTTWRSVSDQMGNVFLVFLHFLIRIPVWALRMILSMFQKDKRFYSFLQMVQNVRACSACLPLRRSS